MTQARLIVRSEDDAAARSVMDAIMGLSTAKVKASFGPPRALAHERVSEGHFSASGWPEPRPVMLASVSVGPDYAALYAACGARPEEVVMLASWVPQSGVARPKSALSYQPGAPAKIWLRDSARGVWNSGAPSAAEKPQAEARRLALLVFYGLFGADASSLGLVRPRKSWRLSPERVSRRRSGAHFVETPEMEAARLGGF